MSIKSFTAAGLAVLAATVAALPAAAQSYPTKPIRYVVPFPPGATSDNVARVITGKLSASLGQPVVIDNRPGAGGTLGTDAVAKADPDGYTLLNATNGFVAIAPHLMKVAYDPLKDLAPVSLIGAAYGLLAVHPAVPAATLKEFVAYAKSKPGQLNYGSAGNGSVTHLMAESLRAVTGIDAVHVPYKGSAANVNDLVNGQTQFSFDPAAMPHVLAGKLKGLAVVGEKRWSALPEVPTMAEAGMPDYKARLWFAVMAPAGTPKPVIETLNQHLVKVLADPDTAAQLAKLGVIAQSSPPEVLARLTAEDHAFFGALIRNNNIRAD